MTDFFFLTMGLLFTVLLLLQLVCFLKLGHTHAGQVWPFSMLTHLIFKATISYFHGLYENIQHENQLVYVSPGLHILKCEFFAKMFKISIQEFSEVWNIQYTILQITVVHSSTLVGNFYSSFFILSTNFECIYAYLYSRIYVYIYIYIYI